MENLDKALADHRSSPRMSRLLRYNCDIKKESRAIALRMQNEGFDFVTWPGAQTGVRFVANRDTIEKIDGGTEISMGDVMFYFE